MDIQKIDEFCLALLQFIKMATRENATKEEVKALPAIAETLRLLTEQWGGGLPPNELSEPMPPSVDDNSFAAKVARGEPFSLQDLRR